MNLLETWGVNGATRWLTAMPLMDNEVRFLHVFLTRWDLPSVSCGKSLVLLVLGPAPFVVLLLLPEAKRKSGWGICGSSAMLRFCFVVLVCSSDLPLLFQLEPLRFIASF